MRYSLADYILTIAIPADVASEFGMDTISIGGEGSYVGSISVRRETATFSTDADATGGWVHNKSLDKHGEVSVTLKQLAPQVQNLINLFKIYEKSSSIVDGLTVQISAADETVCVCNDCMIGSIPEQSFGERAGDQTWTLTAGQVIFE